MNQNNQQRPTPETLDFYRKVKGTPFEKYWSAIGKCEQLERERDEAREKLVSACKDWADDDSRVKAIAQKHGIDVEAADDGCFRTVVDVAEAMSAQLEAMRKAIKEAYELLISCGCAGACEKLFLSKLQPFLKP